jgi:hypothetical protein
VPAAGVRAAHDLPTGPERAQQAWGDREAATVGLARCQLEALGEGRDPFAQLGRGGGTVGMQAAQHLVEHAFQPGSSVLGQAVGLHLLGQAGAQLLEDPRRGTPPHRREQVAGEGEECAPHSELLDHRPLLVERPVDVRPARVDASERRQVDAGRLGGVQAGHLLDRLRDRARAGAQRVPGGQPRAPLGVGDFAHDPILAAASDRASGTMHA